MDSCKSDPTIPQWSNFGTATPFVLQLEAGKTACVSGTPWYQHISAEWLTNIHHWVVHDEIGLHPWPGRQARLAASQTLSAGAGECRFSPLNNCHLGANYTHLIYIYDIYIYILHMIDTLFFSIWYTMRYNVKTPSTKINQPEWITTKRLGFESSPTLNLGPATECPHGKNEQKWVTRLNISATRQIYETVVYTWVECLCDFIFGSFGFTFRCNQHLHSGNQTWEWENVLEIEVSLGNTGNIIQTWRIVHCHVWLTEGKHD